MPAKIPYHRPTAARGPATGPSRDAARHYERGADRREAKRFYKSPAWRKLRALVLSEQPLCADCARRGRLTAAVDVHHVRERRERPDLALERSNLEGLCKRCHNRRRRLSPA